MMYLYKAGIDILQLTVASISRTVSQIVGTDYHGPKSAFQKYNLKNESF